MNDVINLRRFRKMKSREEAQKLAQENRVAHGRTKAERKMSAAQAEAARRHIDGHRLEKESAAPDGADAPRKT